MQYTSLGFQKLASTAEVGEVGRRLGGREGMYMIQTHTTLQLRVISEAFTCISVSNNFSLVNAANASALQIDLVFMMLGWEEQKNELFSELITSSDLSNMFNQNPDSLTLTQKDLSAYIETELKWSHAWCVHT